MSDAIDRDEEVTAENCAEELIRTPGSIQPQGFLLMLDFRGKEIVLASENAEEFLGLPMKLILGAQVSQVLDREVLAGLDSLSNQQAAPGMQTYLGAYHIREELCSVVAHRLGMRLVLEFEKLDRLVGAEMMNAIITNFVGKLSKLNDAHTLFQAITDQIQELTGFDRVLLYSFDEEGHGHVLTESNTGNLPSYLDLHFPASDIPQQARALYVTNTIRIIPDANYTPSHLMASPKFSAKNLDLSLSVLRSISPVHLQYMKNMGTGSSMSVSILCEGRLWGLISAHNASPRSVPYLIRSACDMLSKLAATQIVSFQNSARLEKKLRFSNAQQDLLTEIAADKEYTTALTEHLPKLQQLTDADGVAVWIDGLWRSEGHAPPYDEILRMIGWLDAQGKDVFCTDHLVSAMPWTDAIADTASGLIAARISEVKQGYVLWFRREVVQTVAWAGEPVKQTNELNELTPRSSFETWSEVKRGYSRPWEEAEIESAANFRTALVTIALQHAEADALLSESRFLQLTQTLPTKIFATDDHGNLTYVNHRWVEAGLRTEGCWFDHANVMAADVERCRESWDRAVETGTDFEEEVRLSTDGGERWHNVHIAPFRGPAAGMRGGWVGGCNDLTERQEREAAMRMTEKLALTGRMTSVIAHEINNPLESITNLMYLLRGEVHESTSAKDYIDLAESELLRISGITKQTLRWNRERNDTVEWSTAGALCDDVLRLFAGKIRNRQVTVDCHGSEVPFYGAMGQIRQVIANLLSNAVDAAPVGGHVTLTASQVSNGSLLAVRDDGAGISPENLAQLFKPFFSTKGDLGNGLGLYISHEIVERHGGQLTVDSKPGRGATFSIFLPTPAKP